MDNAPRFVAAIDLGSNSFHMVIGRTTHGRVRVVDRMKDMVQLAAGLDDDDRIDEATQERALACLHRFGQRLRGFERRGVRAVGTNTLRRAHQSTGFLARAEEALGYPIEIISGREEARLIYQGVAHNISDVAEQRLVVDIGGGSTEFIIGRRFTPLQMESLYMGCVSMSRNCFPDGAITADGMQRAELLAAQELEPIQRPYRRIGWGHAIGASGTILAIRDIVRGQGWSDDGITMASLQRLRAYLIEAGHVDNLELPPLQRRRIRVFPGGVAILIAAFEALGIRRMHCSAGALREGILHDLQGRLAHTDMRESAIDELIKRYHVDVEQANRVERTALHFRAQVDRYWSLRKDFYGNLLSWAARLHEVGVAIAHSQYHKHGAYVLEYSDLPGFSRQEQMLMGRLVRIHRRKFAVAELGDLDAKLLHRMTRLAVLLRLAIVMHRSRQDVAVPDIQVTEDEVQLRFEAGWLAEHPLTRADLDQEAMYFNGAGLKLTFE
jgi:exopolyphosphatase/guanosine-5'-triphosphate,3'-diphosphate pyrophosphatase